MIESRQHQVAETLAGQLPEQGRQVQIVGRVVDVDVAQVRAEQGKQMLHVGLLALPPLESSDGVAVTKRVEVCAAEDGAALPAPRSIQPELSQELLEG